MTAIATEDVLARHARSTACEGCGKPIIRGTNQAQKRFCGPSCRAAAYRRRLAGLPENFPRLANDHGRFSLDDERLHLPDPPAHVTATSHSTSNKHFTHAPAGLCPP